MCNFFAGAGEDKTLLHSCESTNGIYSKGELEDLAKYKWYHGKLTREQADAALSDRDHKSFLIRHHYDKLILSRSNRGQIYHAIIQRSPKGYQLEGKRKLFSTIPEMITYYQQTLGTAVEALPTGNNTYVTVTDR